MAALRGDRGPLNVETTASRTATTITLSVTAKGFEGTDTIAATSMTPTARIIHGMARQLRSTLVHDLVAGRYSVSFAASAP